MVQRRVLETAKGQFLFRVTAGAREFLLKEGTDQRYGARHLKRAIERHVVYPLANLLATEQVRMGDLICIDWNRNNGHLTFEREGEGALVGGAPSQPAEAARAAGAVTGRPVETPAETDAQPAKIPTTTPAAAPAAAPAGRRKPQS
jgi:hypothetical protein